MLKNLLVLASMLGFAMQALAIPSVLPEDQIEMGRSGGRWHHSDKGLAYAVFYNQSEVETGNIVPWAPSITATPNITVDNEGNITLPRGVFFVEYTVRVDEGKPVGPTNSGIAQLQQTVAGVPTSISQPAVISNSNSQGEDQITGFAIISVSSNDNNQISLLITLNGAYSMPATVGLDANAQIAIIQLR